MHVVVGQLAPEARGHQLAAGAQQRATVAGELLGELRFDRGESVLVLPLGLLPQQLHEVEVRLVLRVRGRLRRRAPALGAPARGVVAVAGQQRLEPRLDVGVILALVHPQLLHRRLDNIPCLLGVLVAGLRPLALFPVLQRAIDDLLGRPRVGAGRPLRGVARDGPGLPGARAVLVQLVQGLARPPIRLLARGFLGLPGGAGDLRDRLNGRRLLSALQPLQRILQRARRRLARRGGVRQRVRLRRGQAGEDRRHEGRPARRRGGVLVVGCPRA
mmetsp:Transcript_9812/g.26186  ORF Transcript_9812/g.26186 Transcript_9812/m.26186 type:complete len:273 (+) Transcript_9812:439-1257(+)